MFSSIQKLFPAIKLDLSACRISRTLIKLLIFLVTVYEVRVELSFPTGKSSAFNPLLDTRYTPKRRSLSCVSHSVSFPPDGLIAYQQIPANLTKVTKSDKTVRLFLLLSLER